MKALTIHQPYASLIAVGAKKFETRSWATKYRGRIAIHAGAGSPFKAARHLSEDAIAAMKKELRDRGIMPLHGDFRYLPFGAIIATAELVECWCIVTHPGSDIDVGSKIPIGAELDVPKNHPRFRDHIVPTEQELLFGDWTPGRYAWEFADVQMLPEPIPVRGQQGLWNWEG